VLVVRPELSQWPADRRKYQKESDNSYWTDTRGGLLGPFNSPLVKEGQKMNFKANCIMRGSWALVAVKNVDEPKSLSIPEN
jgi:hypothetical protein